MGKCIKCGRTIADSEERYYGVIERHSNTGDASHASTTIYKAIALIRIGVCRNCNQSTGNASVMKNVGMFFGGVAFTLIAGLISRKADTDTIGVFGLVGILMLISGLVGLIRDLIRKKSKTNAFETLAIDGELKPEWIIWPYTEKSISFNSAMNFQNINRHHFEYIYVGEKELQKPETEKGKENSKAYAMDVLRRQAREHHIFS